MINNNTHKTIPLRRVITVLCVLAVVSAIALITFAAQPVWSEVNIASEYAYGTIFTVPERSVQADGKTVAATHTVMYPDGASTLKSKITLDMSGVYTICYQVNLNGKPYVEEVTFLVKDYLYYFDTDKSSAAYEAGKGLSVQLAEGDTMHFNSIIDMNSVTLDDVLLEAFATPEEQGRFDFKRLYFTFTDVEDPNSYLTFSARHSASSVDNPYTYAMVGGNGQLLTGMEQFGSELRKHVEGTSNFGMPFSHSFKDSSVGIIRFRFDTASTTAYANERSIAVLNDPEHFSTLWSGFSSGRVRLSITAGLYETSIASFCLKTVKDVDLSAGTLDDTTGPVIRIENPYGDTMPAAAKGCGYGVFPATAKDANTGECKVKINVWYNYTSEHAVMVDVVDGKFSTDRVGNYAIVYEAADRLGNVTKQVLWVYAHETVPAPSVQLTADRPTDMVLGDLLIPAQYEAACHSGKTTVSITAELNGEKYDLTAADFRPEQAGTYTVTYMVTDYIGQTGTASYQVEAKAGDKPVFVDQPVFPQVLIAGSEYALPQLYVNDYRSGKLERKLVGAEITDSEGAKQVAVNGTFIPQIKNNADKITVAYTCDGAVLTKQIPVIQPWRVEEGSSRPKLNLENYLYSAAADLDYVKTDAAITVSAKTADASWCFANQLLAEKFSLIFKGVADRSDFEALDVTLADANDPTIAVTLHFVNNGKRNALIQLGATQATTACAFGLGSEFLVTYTNGSVFVGSTGYTVEKDDSGRAFNGFPSGKLVAGIRFVNARNGAAYDLLSVSGYAMSNLTSDRTGPNVVVLEEYGGSYSINQEVTIPAAMAGDVLDPNVTFQLTVTDPNGQVATALDGTKLSKVDPTVSYTVKLDQYGQYSVRLAAADTFNGKANETVLPYTINVDDEEAPKITFAGATASSAKVGDTLVLPSFTVADNVTAAEAIKIVKFVHTPNGRLLPLTGDTNAVTAVQSGVYEFRIYISDDAGNMQLIRQAITVAESEGV